MWYVLVCTIRTGLFPPPKSDPGKKYSQPNNKKTSVLLLCDGGEALEAAESREPEGAGSRGARREEETVKGRGDDLDKNEADQIIGLATLPTTYRPTLHFSHLSPFEKPLPDCPRYMPHPRSQVQIPGTEDPGGEQSQGK